MGYLRRRGKYCSIVPPLFAARLVEDLAATRDESLRILFHALSKESIGRFLERMVTVDLPENSAFWDYIFGSNGPLEGGIQTNVHFDHVNTLARAVPGRTARFLESKLNSDTKSVWRRHDFVSTLRELAYEAESCAPGMRCLELIAISELEQTNELKESHLFCECFVDWYHDFPMSYQERSAWIERLLKSTDRTRRLLGAHIIAFVTSPPQSLSGYSVTARRLGQTPVKRLWRDVFDYVTQLVEIRFELTQSSDEEIAKIARKDFDRSLSQLIGHLSPDQLVSILEKLVAWSFVGKLTSDERNIRNAIHWIEERYKQNSQNPGQEEFRDKWTALLKRLTILRERFDNGDFALRLKVATGNHSFDMEWEEGKEGRTYRYQEKLRALALEAVSTPKLMTEKAWVAVKDANSFLAGEFLGFLGECDLKRHFLALFESEAVDHAGRWRFAIYCSGHYRCDPIYTEGYLGQLAQTHSVNKGVLLMAMAFIGPTPANQKWLLQFIAERSVKPMEVANMFRAGRWLDCVPPSDVATIMEYIAQGDHWAQTLADVMSLYLYLNKPLPKELFPMAKRVLSESHSALDDSYHCNQIAIGIAAMDLEAGFALLEERIAILNKEDRFGLAGEWNPLSRYGGHEFWNYLRSRDAERAYRCFSMLRNRHLRGEITSDDNRPLFDLENHRFVLLKIANESEKQAESVASSISFKQPGFLAFAFELLSNRSIDGSVASCLASTVIDHDGFGTQIDKLKTTLEKIESELKKVGLPDHGVAWLRRLRDGIKEAIKTSPWNRGDQEYLGWL